MHCLFKNLQQKITGLSVAGKVSHRDSTSERITVTEEVDRIQSSVVTVPALQRKEDFFTPFLGIALLQS
jgi:hypothetical protein